MQDERIIIHYSHNFFSILFIFHHFCCYYCLHTYIIIIIIHVEVHIWLNFMFINFTLNWNCFSNYSWNACMKTQQTHIYFGIIHTYSYPQSNWMKSFCLFVFNRIIYNRKQCKNRELPIRMCSRSRIRKIEEKKIIIINIRSFSQKY